MKKHFACMLLAVLGCFLLTSCLARFQEITTTDTQEKSTSESVRETQPSSVETTISTNTEAETSFETETEITESSSSSEPILSDEARAYEILQDMTLADKVGQMFFVRCPEGDAISAVKTWHLGGFILFPQDFNGKTEEQIIENITAFQNASQVPMLIGTDEEGGPVVRVSRYRQFRAAPFLSPKTLFDTGGLDLVRSDTAEKSILLKRLGLNVNLAPICDVSTNPGDFIYNRSFGQPAKETAEYVKTVVEEMVSQRTGCVLKHFPGYGNNEDTHTGIVYDNRSYDTFRTSDFLPFSAGIKAGAGAGAVLVSHNIVTCMDAQLPASLSPAVHEILRNELGFDGVIMTDDLYMDAIKDYTGGKEAAVLAVLAGNDLLISTDFDVQIPAVLAAVENGEISETSINESVMRILMWKLSLEIIS